MAKTKTKTQTQPEAGSQEVAIPPPRFAVAEFCIVGNSCYVQNKFSRKAREQIRATQEAGSTAKKTKRREPKDFESCYKQAMYVSHDGWHGIPAPSFRNAMISACRIVGFTMTHAKLSVFVEADGRDVDDATPLVRITKGEPRYHESYVRNETGVVDLRARPMWDPGWEAIVRVKFDLEQFTLTDVTNLMARCGLQVGIGEGRPDSKKSCGIGWGTFEVKHVEQ